MSEYIQRLIDQKLGQKASANAAAMKAAEQRKIVLEKIQELWERLESQIKQIAASSKGVFEVVERSQSSDLYVKNTIDGVSLYVSPTPDLGSIYVSCNNDSPIKAGCLWVLTLKGHHQDSGVFLALEDRKGGALSRTLYSPESAGDMLLARTLS
jgi:hypothetical protein